MAEPPRPRVARRAGSVPCPGQAGDAGPQRRAGATRGPHLSRSRGAGGTGGSAREGQRAGLLLRAAGSLGLGILLEQCLIGSQEIAGEKSSYQHTFLLHFVQSKF